MFRPQAKVVAESGDVDVRDVVVGVSLVKVVLGLIIGRLGCNELLFHAVINNIIKYTVFLHL